MLVESIFKNYLIFMPLINIKTNMVYIHNRFNSKSPESGIKLPSDFDDHCIKPNFLFYVTCTSLFISGCPLLYYSAC